LSPLLKKLLKHMSLQMMDTSLIFHDERIKMPKRGVNWAFLKFIARIESY
jgi:hypothetical protein